MFEHLAFLPNFINLAFNATGPPPRIPSPGLSTAPCPFQGQIYPPPVNIASSPIWHDAMKNLSDALASIQSLQNNDTSFGMQMVSLHATEPLFERYNKAPVHLHQNKADTPINGDTVFRIASVSKLFTVSTILLNCGFKCFEDPITKYVPELVTQHDYDPVSDVDWDEVTVGALAAQISGIGRDYALGDLATIPFLFPGTQFGFPDVRTINSSQITTCGANVLQPPCSRKESIDRLRQHNPNFPTWYTPSYSNTAFELLGYVVENLTGKSYEDAVIESVIEPLGLTHTTATLPDPGDGVIIPGDPTFIWDFGPQTPTGGIYSSTNDLSRLALALLNNTLLPPSQTRRWLKPHSHSSLIQFSMGAPWEIFRIPGVSENHWVDMYTKNGNLGTYTTQYAVFPDLELGLAVNALTLDPAMNAVVLANVMIHYTLGPFFVIAKQQARERFAGTYVSDRGGVNSSMHVTTDDEIGLVVDRWVSNGTDMIEALRIWGSSGRPVRLFPTTLSSKSQSKDGSKDERVAFRARILDSPGICLSWGVTDALRWAGYGVDLFVFEVEVEDGSGSPEGIGKAMAVDLPAFRTRLVRDETDGGRKSGLYTQAEL